jgi:hypothetical protein
VAAAPSATTASVPKVSDPQSLATAPRLSSLVKLPGRSYPPAGTPAHFKVVPRPNHPLPLLQLGEQRVWEVELTPWKLPEETSTRQVALRIVKPGFEHAFQFLEGDGVERLQTFLPDIFCTELQVSSGLSWRPEMQYVTLTIDGRKWMDLNFFRTTPPWGAWPSSGTPSASSRTTRPRSACSSRA